LEKGLTSVSHHDQTLSAKGFKWKAACWLLQS